MDGYAQEWPRLTHTDNGLAMDQLGGDLPLDVGFEPQTRARSNTWPCPRPENFVEPTDELDSTKASNQQLAPGGWFLQNIINYIYILISYFNNILSNRLTAGYTECECSEEELIASQCMGKSILCGSHHACHWIGHRQTIDTESDLRVDGPECAIFQG